MSTGEGSFDRLWRSIDLANPGCRAHSFTGMFLSVIEIRSKRKNTGINIKDKPAKMNCVLLQTVKMVLVGTEALTELTWHRAESSITHVLIVVLITVN